MQTITPTAPSSDTTIAAESRSLYQTIQVAGLVAPFVDALSRTHNLDAVWVVAFPYVEMAHPTRPTLKLSTVIKRAEQAATMEHMRVDSLESARSALAKASQYSDWTEASYAPLLELLEIAIAAKRR
ncbi:MAG: hypothetical protein V4627_07740 [Pseudomonadota bacterium]